MAETAKFGEVIIRDGEQQWHFPVVGGVINVQNLSVFQRKGTIGDYTADSNPTISTWITTDLSAGHGVQQLNEAVDTGRYRFGVIDPRRPRQITLPPLTTIISGPGSAPCKPLGMFKGSFYLAFGSDLYTGDANAGTVTDTTINLTSAPISRWVAIYRGKLFVPLGSSFDTFNGAAVTNHNTIDAIAFCRWDKRLFALDASGQLWQTFDGTTWENIGDDALIDDGSTMRAIVAFYDRSDFPMPIVVTNQQLHAFDPSGPTVYPTEAEWVPHRDMGLGATKWRAELFIAVAMGIFKYNGETLSAMGLDRDQGLPPDIRGKIVDLQNAYNEMYALVSGAEFIEDVDADPEFDSTDDDMTVSDSSAVSSLHIWTAYGWHCYWTSDAATGLPSWMGVQSDATTYALWWGVGDNAACMVLPIDFSNARSLIESGTGRFAPFGYLETGEFDAGLTGYTKIANSLLVRADCPGGSAIQVLYRTSSNAGWTPLGMVTTSGETVLSFGEQGTNFVTVEFRYEFARGASVSDAPIITSAVFSFQKIIPAYHSISFRVDLNTAYEKRSPKELKASLEAFVASPKFYELDTGEEKYRGRVAQVQGSEMLGQGDDRSDVTVSFIEIRSDL